MASRSDLPDEALEGVESALSADLTAMSSSALREREIGLMWLVELGRRSALVQSVVRPEFLTQAEAELTRTQQARLEALRRERELAGLSVWGPPSFEIPGGGAR